jgi:hypothetical protein
MGEMIHLNIVYFGKQCVLACDAQCHKAWGINNRPRVYLEDPTGTVYPNDDHHYPQDEKIDGDNYAFLADDELGEAPFDPGTYEGGHAKPTLPEDRLNKWCARECERSDIADSLDDIDLDDYSVRQYNFAPHVRE